VKAIEKWKSAYELSMVPARIRADRHELRFMDHRSRHEITHGRDGAGRPSDAGVRPGAGGDSPRPRRTLGLCAHCHRPVEIHEEHVRLYRLAWHLDCALASESPAPPDLPPAA
jgi:hypothetical protein